MKKIIKYIFLFLILGLVYVVYTSYPKLNIITGFSAKSAASGVFLAKRTLESVEKGDNDFSPISKAENKVDISDQSVTSEIYGQMKRKAIFVDGLGAILINDDFDPKQQFEIPKRNKVTKNIPFPYGSLPQIDNDFVNIDYKALQIAVDNAFDIGEEKSKRSRSVLVVYKDQIIAEKYADGFDENTLMLGWSMTKSIAATMYGILQKKGLIDINSVTGIPEWQKDDRKNITYNDLLHMNSGLEWEEDYFSLSDVSKMLFLETDMGKVQLNKPLAGKPNETWNYSSGTTNLLSGYLLRQQFKTHQEYLDFWYAELLIKLECIRLLLNLILPVIM